MLRSLSPQLRLGVYKNRLVGAVWLLLLTGALTAAEPYIQIQQRLEVSLGLLAPATLARWLGQSGSSPLHIILAASAGGVLIVLGILTGLNKMTAARISVLILALDLSLLWVGTNARIEVPQSITIFARLCLLYYVVGGIRAAAKRTQLLGEMAAADKEYEAELKAGTADVPPGFCRQCGQQLVSSDRFCRSCGAKAS